MLVLVSDSARNETGPGTLPVSGVWGGGRSHSQPALHNGSASSTLESNIKIALFQTNRL